MTEVAKTLEVPKIDALSVAFGDIKHMPKYADVPEDFKRSSNPFVRAVSSWFFSGAKSAPNGLTIDGTTYTAKPGIDAKDALHAIKAVLGSFEPKHEHKEAACAFMLSEWFTASKADAA